tara:strand:+ start:272 stop:982 length:711 start_codon:yes stop_codon:yes gene_type:complete
MSMTTNRIAEIGMMVGDPARASILAALMDGRALTAGELATVAGVTAQTTSGHLSRLTQSGLLAMEKQGRHRYFRLAGPDIARMLEGIMQIASSEVAVNTRKLSTGPRDASMRRARTCYDHFAGKLGVAIATSLVDLGYVEFDGDSGIVTEGGMQALTSMGIDISGQVAKKKGARPVCRPCLDWSERVPHVAGRLGAVICRHYFDQGYVRRLNDSRALEITPPGQQALRQMFNIPAL